MNEQIQSAHANDIFKWPDGSCCYRYEFRETPRWTSKGDEYEVIPFRAPTWAALPTTSRDGEMTAGTI